MLFNVKLSLAAAAKCLLIGVLVVAGQVQAATLTVTGSLWPPYLDGDLPEGGLAAEIVRTAFTTAGYEIEVKVENWPRAYQGTALGVYDVVAAVWETAEREDDLVFSEAYLLNDIVLVAHKGGRVQFRGDPSTLKGFRVGVVRDYAYEPVFDAAEFERVVSDHLIQSLLLLRQGRVDVIVGDEWSIIHQVARFMPDDVAYLERLPTPVTRRALRIGVSREHAQAEQIVADFNRALAELRADGTYKAIVRRHTEAMPALPRKR